MKIKKKILKIFKQPRHFLRSGSRKYKQAVVVIVIFLVGILVGGKVLVDKPARNASQSDAGGEIIMIGDKYATVQKVIDGDTIDLDNGQRVRLLGINAPENGRCYYNEAKDALQDLVLNKQVRLEKDISGQDSYDRLLRYVILPNTQMSADMKADNADKDDILINDYLVRQGFVLAEHHPPDVRYRSLFYVAQTQARNNKLGIWQYCDYEQEAKTYIQKDIAPPSPACIIKGNVSEKNFGKTYLVPGCDNYNNVKIDPRKGDAYFCTEEEAVEAGFRKAGNCP